MPVLPAPASATHVLGTTRFTALASPSRGGARDTSVWRVEIAPGAPATPHRLTREEVFVVLAGRALVNLGADRLEAGPGDVIVVPAATDFALTASGDAPLEALCCLPVGGQALLPGGEPFTPPWAA